MLISNLFFIIFSLPNYILATLINLFFITKEKLINLKNLKDFFFKNISILYVLFLISIFYNKFLNYNHNSKSILYNIFSLIFIQFYKKKLSNKKFFWILSIIYFFYNWSSFFNNIILSCVISNNGFFDFLSIANNEPIILNISKYNCDNYYQQGLLEHQTNFKFKYLFFIS